MKHIEDAALKRLAEYAMSNLTDDDTGITNIVIWCSVKNASHGPRIKVSNIRGSLAPNDLFSMDLTGKTYGTTQLKSSELLTIKDWVTLNTTNLIDYWNFKISTKQFMDRIVKV